MDQNNVTCSWDSYSNAYLVIYKGIHIASITREPYSKDKSRFIYNNKRFDRLWIAVKYAVRDYVKNEKVVMPVRDKKKTVLEFEPGSAYRIL